MSRGAGLGTGDWDGDWDWELGRADGAWDIGWAPWHLADLADQALARETLNQCSTCPGAR